MAKSAAQITEKWQRRAQQATQDYTAGIDAVTESPTAKAALKLDKAGLNYMEAINSGRTKRALERVDVNQWKEAAKTKGGARYASGVTAAAPKMQEFMNAFLPYAEQVSAEVARMPDVTIEDNIARSAYAQRKLHEFKGRR